MSFISNKIQYNTKEKDTPSIKKQTISVINQNKNDSYITNKNETNTNPNNLRQRMINLEYNLNDLTGELDIHRKDVTNLKSEKEMMVKALIEIKNQMKNDFFKEVKKINDEMEFVIKEQRNHINSLEERLKLQNVEKEKLNDQIFELKNRIVDLESQVGYCYSNIV